MPDDRGEAVVLVQGDTGPGNFMYAGAELVAITDWELAHWGDRHDDLAWILVRDTLERFPDLAAPPARRRDREWRRASIPAARATSASSHSSVPPSARSRDCAATTCGEIAWQLIYNTLHTRVLGESLATVAGVPLPEPVEADDDGEHAWVYDVALRDLRHVVVPAARRPFAATWAKGLARLLKYLRAVDASGEAFSAAERSELADLLGAPVDDLDDGAARSCARIESGALTAVDVLPHCLAHAARETALMRGAMGVLADRHVTPVDHLLGGT